MTEPDDVRTLLGAALHGEPPDVLDPARLMKLGKRRLLLQRASAALGVVVIAGGIAIGAGFLRPHNNNANPDQITAAATSAPPASTIPTTMSGPPSVAQTPVVLASDVIATQNAVLQKEYSAVVSGLGSGLVPVSGHLAFVATTPSGPVGVDYLGSSMAVRLGDRRGTGDFLLNADVTTGADPSTVMHCDAGKLTCAIQTIDGISVEVEIDHPTAKTTRIVTVALSPSGKVLVNGTSDNLDSPKTRNATRPSPPLTAAQLARITAAVAEASP